MSMLHVTLHIRDEFPYYISMQHVLAACPNACPSCMLSSMSIRHVHAASPWWVSMLHGRGTSTCRMSAPHGHFNTACPLLHVHAVYPCCVPMSMLHVISLLHVHAECFWNENLHVHALRPCLMSMLYVHDACPCCMSMMLVHAACPYCMSLLHVLADVHAACLASHCYPACLCCMPVRACDCLNLSLLIILRRFSWINSTVSGMVCKS